MNHSTWLFGSLIGILLFSGNLVAQSGVVDRYGDPLPAGALYRLGTTRYSQGFIIERVIFAPDGKSLAIAGCGQELGIWEFPSGKVIRQLGKSNQPRGIGYSPDGKWIVEGAFRDVKIFDVQTGKLHKNLQGHTNGVRAAVFSPDGKLIASGCHDKTTKIWDVASGTCLHTLQGHGGSVIEVAFSPDGKWLATGGTIDPIIRIWETDKFTLFRELVGHKKSVLNLIFSQDSQFLFSSGEDEVFYQWNLKNGKIERTFGEGQKWNHVQALALSTDGQTLASCAGTGFISLWDWKTGQELRKWKAHAFYAKTLAFAPDGKTLASGTVWESRPRFWDVATGKEKYGHEHHYGPIHEMRLLEDGKTLLSHSTDRRILSWDLATQQSKEIASFPDRYFFFTAISPNGRYHALSGLVDEETRKLKHKMIVWDAKQRQDVGLFLESDQRIWYSQFSPDSQWLATSSQAGQIEVWDVPNHKRLYQWQGRASQEMGLSFTSDKRFLYTCCGSSDEVVVYDLQDGKIAKKINHLEKMNHVQLSPDDRYFAVGGLPFQKKYFFLYDAKTDQLLHQLDTADDRGVYRTAFSKDSWLLAGSGVEDTSGVFVWETATGQNVAHFFGHHSAAMPLAFTPDNRRLISGAGDSTLLVWDLAQRKPDQPMDAKRLDQLWDLLTEEASKAVPAIFELADHPEVALPFLKQKIHKAEKIDVERFQTKLAQLNAPRFRDRQKASQEILDLGYGVEPLIRKALSTEKQEEARQRLQDLLTNLTKSNRWYQTLRGLQTLKQMNHPEAQTYLQELSTGVPEALFTQEAKRLAELGKK